MNQSYYTENIFLIVWRNCPVSPGPVVGRETCVKHRCVSGRGAFEFRVPLKQGGVQGGRSGPLCTATPLLFHHLSWQRGWFIGALWPSVRAGTVGYINPGDNPSTREPLSASKWPSVSQLERNPLPRLNQCHKLPISMMSIDHKMM